nr:MAG TPA: hypothetical protein [Caudoviricetes sp.]
MHGKGQESSCVGVAWGCSAKEMNCYELLSKGIEWQRIAMAMNGRE